MELKRIVCYANINSFNCPEGVSDQHMRSFFNLCFQKCSVEIVDVIVDRHGQTKPLAMREGWQKLVGICRTQRIDCIVVPTIQMLESSVVSVAGLAREFELIYRAGFSFLLEDIAKGGEDFTYALQLHSILMDTQERMKTNADRMRRLFWEATGLDEGASAMPVHVEWALYEAARKKAYEYGDNIAAFVQYLLQFAVDPANADIIDRYVYGKDPSKYQ